MDPSSQWLAKWLQRLSSTDNTVFESPVRGWRGREWRVLIEEEGHNEMVNERV